MKSAFKQSFILFLALIFLLAGITALPPVFAHFFSEDDSISLLSIRLILYFISIASFTFSVFLILQRKKLSSSASFSSITHSALFGGSIILSLILGELILRIFYPVPNGMPNHNHLFYPDSTYGWRFIPDISAEVNWRYESQVDVNINSSGFRDDEFTDEPYIAVLGDSFVAGMEMEDDQRFTELLEKQLKISVRNYGLNGYGPTQSLLQLKNKITSENLQMVIFQIYLRNDFHDVSGAYEWMAELQRPKAIISGDSVTTILPAQNLPEIDVEYWRSYFQSDRRKPIRPQNFHLYNLMTKTKETITDRWFSASQDRPHPPERRLLSSETDSLFQKAFSDTRVILREMHQISDDYNVPFLVTIAPTFVQADDEIWDEFTSRYPDESFNREKLSEMIKKWGVEDHYQVVDLLPALRKASDDETLYFPINQHWTPAGHTIVADKLLPVFSKVLDGGR